MSKVYFTLVDDDTLSHQKQPFVYAQIALNSFQDEELLKSFPDLIDPTCGDWTQQLENQGYSWLIESTKRQADCY